VKRSPTPPSSHWRLVDRGGWPVHIHESDDLWIVQYDAAPTAGYPTEHWTVYYRIAKRKKGAEPWSVNNKSLGDYLTLEAAMLAGEAWFTKDEKTTPTVEHSGRLLNQEAA
jgi:hypothetical protein